MKLGISALLYNLEDALNICDKFKEITHIEIGIDNLYECKELLKYKSRINENGITLGVHLPMELNTCENVEYIRDSWIDFIYKINDELSDFNIEYFNMHLGYAITNRLSKNRKKYLDNSIRFLQDEKLLINKKISIENVYTKHGDYSNIGNQVSDFEYIFSKVGKHVSFCYDTGHNLINRDNYIQSLKHKISVVHLSDNDGKEDLHVGIGKGILLENEIRAVLSLKSDYIILEIEYMYIEDTINKLGDYKKG
ncbi:MAG: sugar phosphate isomerase/epimerase family protein [Peptostreptococcaceae bacterium]